MLHKISNCHGPSGLPYVYYCASSNGTKKCLLIIWSSRGAVHSLGEFNVLKPIQIRFKHLELSVILQVSTVEGCSTIIVLCISNYILYCEFEKDLNHKGDMIIKI